MLLGNADSKLALEEKPKPKMVREGSNLVSWLESKMLKPKPENSYYKAINMCFTFFFLNLRNFCSILGSAVKRYLGNRRKKKPIRWQAEPKRPDAYGETAS